MHRISLRPDRISAGRRLFNSFYFPSAVFVRILFGRRYDVMMCSTSPPVLLGVAVSIASRLRRVSVHLPLHGYPSRDRRDLGRVPFRAAVAGS